MIVVYSYKLKKFIVAPNKTGSVTIETIGNYHLDRSIWKTTKLSYWQPAHSIAWKNFESAIMIRNPIDWHASGYAFSRTGRIGRPSDSFEKHLRRVITVRDYIKKTGHVRKQDLVDPLWVSHCVINPADILDTMPNRPSTYIKLEYDRRDKQLERFFEDNIKVNHTNKSSLQLLPKLDNITIGLLETLYYGEQFGYNIKTDIERYNLRIK